MWIAHNWSEDHIQQGLARLSCYLHIWKSSVSICLDILWASLFPVGVCVCLWVCVCAEGERLRETDREKDLPNFPDLFLYFLIRKWWHNNDTIKHLVFVLYSSHAKRPELYRPQKSGITPHKSEDSQGQCLKKDRLFPVLAKHTNKQKKEKERETKHSLGKHIKLFTTKIRVKKQLLLYM